MNLAVARGKRGEWQRLLQSVLKKFHERMPGRARWLSAPGENAGSQEARWASAPYHDDFFNMLSEVEPFRSRGVSEGVDSRISLMPGLLMPGSTWMWLLKGRRRPGL